MNVLELYLSCVRYIELSSADFVSPMSACCITLDMILHYIECDFSLVVLSHCRGRYYIFLKCLNICLHFYDHKCPIFRECLNYFVGCLLCYLFRIYFRYVFHLALSISIKSTLDFLVFRIEPTLSILWFIMFIMQDHFPRLVPELAEEIVTSL